MRARARACGARRQTGGRAGAPRGRERSARCPCLLRSGTGSRGRVRVRVCATRVRASWCQQIARRPRQPCADAKNTPRVRSLLLRAAREVEARAAAAEEEARQAEVQAAKDKQDRRLDTLLVEDDDEGGGQAAAFAQQAQQAQQQQEQQQQQQQQQQQEEGERADEQAPLLRAPPPTASQRAALSSLDSWAEQTEERAAARARARRDKALEAQRRSGSRARQPAGIKASAANVLMSLERQLFPALPLQGADGGGGDIEQGGGDGSGAHAAAAAAPADDGAAAPDAPEADVRPPLQPITAIALAPGPLACLQAAQAGARRWLAYRGALLAVGALLVLLMAGVDWWFGSTSNRGARGLPIRP